ncbi:MAG: efflux RND transporter permease subunit [Bacteroidales bacterium]|nr:efflux RND transporter permease subunit [Bacteroidales bacterium]
MKLPKLAIDNYQFTILVFILLTIVGINSYLNMPRMENPEMLVPGGSIIVIYPGANPVDMEQLVASPIEESINELEDIKKIDTELRDGIAIISVEFIFGTDAKEKYDELVQKVNSVKNELPDNIFSLTTLQWKSSDVAMLQLALVSDSAKFSELKNKAEKFKTEINKVSGIRKVEIIACPEQEIRISLDVEKMAQMNISIDNVANAIKSNNANIPGGSIDLANKSFGIKTSGSYNNLDEIRNTVVNSYQGRLIYLKNIAEVNFNYEDNNYYARYNGKRGIIITVKQKEGLNIFKITNKIKPKIENFIAELDKDMSLYYVFNQANEVDVKINGFISNLLQGILLVGFIILLALGFKSALIVIIAIPLSNLIGLWVVNMADFGLEQMSIAGLVVALGLLVDNSIVMVENINRFIKMGYKPREAAIKGASEIGWPIVSATVTTLLAFVPIITMPDKAGEFIRSMPVTIIATLSVSLLIALTLTPLIAFKTLKEKKKSDINNEEKKSKTFSKVLQRFIEGPYRRILNFALNNKALILISAILFLCFSIFIFRYVGISFFPKADKPQFMIRINLPEGAKLDRTDEVARYVEAILDTTENVKYYATNVGHGNPRIYYNVMSNNYAKNFADIFVQLHKYDVEEFNCLINTLRKEFKEFPGARINIKEFEQGVPSDAPIMIYINGKDMDILKSIAYDVEKFLKNEKGAINIDNQLAKSRTDIYFNINKDKASLFGVPVYEIDKTIRTCLSGASISKYRDKDGNEYNIVLRLPINDKIKLTDFDKIYVKAMTGRLIPLKQLASIEFKKAPSSITRYNLERTALIMADVETGTSIDDIMNPVIEKLDNYPFPKGYNYRIGGELENRSETFGGMFTAGIIALISIFSVLVLQFKSFTQPLIIFIAIPFAVIGMIWALLISGNSFSFTAFIGFISLVGIVINNSIILVDYTNNLRKEGIPLLDAIKKASETRFTPIILTTLTTIGGLLPLTLSGGTMWAPMGWTIIGGLLVSTILSLIVVPILYKIFSAETLQKVISIHEKFKNGIKPKFR